MFIIPLAGDPLEGTSSRKSRTYVRRSPCVGCVLEPVWITASARHRTKKAFLSCPIFRGQREPFRKTEQLTRGMRRGVIPDCFQGTDTKHSLRWIFRYPAGKRPFLQETVARSSTHVHICCLVSVLLWIISTNISNLAILRCQSHLSYTVVRTWGVPCVVVWYILCVLICRGGINCFTRSDHAGCQLIDSLGHCCTQHALARLQFGQDEGYKRIQRIVEIQCFF